MIGIVDYGSGNVMAFVNAYRKLSIAAQPVGDPASLDLFDRLILPGVGSFDYAMDKLSRSGFLSALGDVVGRKRIPILGVCVGMQMLAGSSEEGRRPGLGWIDGRVRRLPVSSTPAPLPIPHMGWNDVLPLSTHGLFCGMDEAARFYFLHSYYFEAQKGEDIIAVTDYGGRFACAVQSGPIYGVQFHPEKSHGWGIQLLRNFADL